MAGKARNKRGITNKLKHQQDTNKELYNISGAVPTQASSSIVSAGSQGGGTYQNNQSADINMNTYDIVDVDRLKFAVKEGAGDALTTDDYGIEALYSGTNAYGIQMSVPATKNINFKRGTDIPISITTSNVTFGDDIQVSSFADFVGVSTPADPASTARRLFSDSGNSNHLSVRTNGGSTIDLEAGSSGANTSLSNLSSVAVNTTLDLNNQNIEDVNALKINSDGAGSADSFTMFGTTSAGAINLIDDSDYFAIQVDGTSKLRIYDGEIQFRENITTDTANTCDIGSGSAWFGHGYMDNLSLMGSNSPALWVTQGTSYFGGYIEIDGRISATGSVGKLGAKTTSDVIGLSTKCWYYGGSSTPYELGTKGTLTSPYDESTTFPSSQSTLDDLFGDATGSIGVYEDTNGTTNYKVKFYYKGDDGWYQVSGTKI